MVKHLQTVSGYTIDAVWGPPFDTPCPFAPGDHLAVTRIVPLEQMRDRICKRIDPNSMSQSTSKIRAWGSYLRRITKGYRQQVQQRADGGYDFLFSHHGIYIGNQQVIHFRGEPHMTIAETNMMSFIGEDSRVIVERVSYPNDKMLPAHETIRRAKDWCTRHGLRVSWQLITHNCEQLATYCKIGKWKSIQVETLDMVTTDYLNEILWRLISYVIEIAFALYNRISSVIWMYLIVMCVLCWIVMSLWGEIRVNND